jgi:predicted DNA-binding transcriptional regulator AlpA
MQNTQSQKERLANLKPKKPTREQRIKQRQELASTFPIDGNVRAKQSAAFLGIGLSTFNKYVAEGRIRKPIKFGHRVSVWDAKYIRELAKNGIPAQREAA